MDIFQDGDHDADHGSRDQDKNADLSKGEGPQGLEIGDDVAEVGKRLVGMRCPEE